MLDHVDKIKKLNVLEKLLRQPFISVRKNLGDEKIIKEINEEIKEFLTLSMEGIFAGSPPPNQQTFSPDQVVMLGQLADKLLAKVKAVGPADSPQSVPLAPPIEQPNSPHLTPQGPSPKKKGSPVLEALSQHGFDPNASPKERIAAVKKLSKAKKGKK